MDFLPRNNFEWLVKKYDDNKRKYLMGGGETFEVVR